ncbi:MAG: hypothetical protein HY814_14260 [Candidatus Riflebacteria bacterium]|nr:hypothetical protein [Candidatus Riflebacteria bacterium]
MDDDVETGASAAPTVDAGASSPAPSESSSPAPKPSLFQSLMGDGEDSGEDPADEADTDGEGSEEPEGEEPPTTEKPDAKQEEPSDEDVPKDLKAVLKKHPELRAAHFYKRDMDALGLTVEEAQTYREHIQSLDDLNYTVSRAQQIEALEGLFLHPDAEAPRHFLTALGQVDERSRDRLVSTIAHDLPRIAPEAYYELVGTGVESALTKLESLAGNDPFRREAMSAVREMIAELESGAAPAAPAQRHLPAPDATELEDRRLQEQQAHEQWWAGLSTRANQAADVAVRDVVAAVVKRRDPDGLLTSPETIDQIVTEVHRTVAGVAAVNRLFKNALADISIPPDQRIAKAAALVRARANNVAGLVFKKRTDGIAERIRNASQLRLGKAAKVVSLREATSSGRTAAPSAPVLKPGVRPTSLDLFRAAMKG